MLLLDSDAEERRKLTVAMRVAGLDVLDVSCIAEVERWPTGDIVITEAERFTPWWKTIGATHVVVLAASAEEGNAACARGANAWVPRDASPDRLIALVQSLLRTDRSSLVADDAT